MNYALAMIAIVAIGMKIEQYGFAAILGGFALTGVCFLIYSKGLGR